MRSAPSSAEVTQRWQPARVPLSSPWGEAADPPTYLPADEDPATGFAQRQRARSDSQSVITSAPRNPAPARAAAPSAVATPAPAVVAPAQPVAPPQAAPQMVPPLGGSIDPNAVPLPPELAPTIYQWMRRLALQADLAGADRLLRDALVDLTSALSVTIIYSGPDGLMTLGTDDELPKDTQAIMAVGLARRAVFGTHAALVPIATATETIAVIQLARNPRQPGFTLAEQVAMAAFARESANVLHHLVVQHLQRASERKADAGSLYRPEALESHRTRGQEGALAELSPGWIKRAYPMLGITILTAVVLGLVLHVNTWSPGPGIVVFDGKEITAPQSGTVDVVAVQTGESVKKGRLLVKLRSEDVEAQLRQTKTELEKQIQEHLFDPTDENVSKQLAMAAAAERRAQANVDQRSVRALQDGVVSDIRVRLGQLLQPGDHILTLVEPGTLPEVWAFLPGKDRPRLHEGQALQVDLIGFTKKREDATIIHVSNEVIGAAAARKFVGQEYADSLQLPEGAYVLVKARLARDSFMSKGQKLYVHHGMPVKTEVRVERKRFITTLLPALEKYVE